MKPLRIKVNGKVGHWGAVGNRVHMIHAMVPPSLCLGDVVTVKVMQVPAHCKCQPERSFAKFGRGHHWSFPKKGKQK
jgi:hypothetical protein